MNGFHHVRARMRREKELEPFPSTNAWKRFLDYLMYGVGIIAPLALLPQIIQIYTTKSSAGVSLFTWLLLALINALWAVYGMAHKDKQLFFANALIVVFDLVIVIGILLY
jgi:uncharacterized protein with PQ loop repeat